MRFNGKLIRVPMFNWDELHLEDGSIVTKEKFGHMSYDRQGYLYSREVKDIVEEDGRIILYI